MPAAIGRGHNTLFAPVSASATAGDTQIIAADTSVAGQRPARKLRIFGLFLVAKAATVVTLKSGATVISGAMPLPLGGVFAANAEADSHLLEVAAGQAFNINTSVDGVYGWVAYTVEDL